MASYYGTRLPHKTGYPGDGYHYVICDICGVKLRAKDATLMTDKFSDKYNLLVCPKDIDITNPQTFIKAFKDKQISNPKLIRSEGPNKFVFIDTANQIEGGDTSDPTGRAPGVPRFLSVIGTTSTTATLQWLGPFDSGSGAISGYFIERESPVGGGFSTVTTTVFPSTYFEDTGLTASTVYNYRVSAVNKDFTGAPSNEASNITAST